MFFARYLCPLTSYSRQTIVDANYSLQPDLSDSNIVSS